MADINEYNERVRKMKRVIEKRQRALVKQKNNIGSMSMLPVAGVSLIGGFGGGSVIAVPGAEAETSKMMLMEKEEG